MILIGLMSGTSLDGITAAVVRFSEHAAGKIEAELLGMIGQDYAPETRERLARALVGATPAEYCRLNFELGEWLAEAAIKVMAEAGVSRSDIAAIASHGQ
jgi:anhydro-N-acetylmuramic acid kinase